MLRRRVEEPQMKEIQIRKQPVELYKILKFEGLADSGGEAKALIDAGSVTVNGKIELRRRNKIQAGDIIGFRGVEFRIVVIEAGMTAGD
jgi:ribosome-associated protein